MRPLTSLFLATALLAATSLPARADVRVVASMKPVHSLVAAVMAGLGQPALLLEGSGSPHNGALKPSQAQMLETAQLVFWIGPELEAFLEKPLQTVGANARSIALMDAHGLVRRGFRDGGPFDAHDHDKADAGAHEDHGPGRYDAHIWLDPVNAKAIVHEIEEALVVADPANAPAYAANAEAMRARLDGLTKEIADTLEPVRGSGFLIFHDAYQYFEKRFGLTASGSITISPDVLAGAERIRDMRARVKELGATCVFAEPQFEPKLVATVTEGTAARSGVLDPLGATLDSGPEMYFQLIRNMASALRTCLSGAS